MTHPVICHLIDVAQVTYALWQQTLPAPLKAQMARALTLDVDETGRLIAFWAGLRDLGKASPGFQRKYAPGQAKLAAAGIPFAKLVAMSEPCPHATVTTVTLAELLGEITQIDERFGAQCSASIGRASWQLAATPRNAGAQELSNWRRACLVEMRRELVRALYQLFTPPSVPILDLSHYSKGSCRNMSCCSSRLMSEQN